MTIAQDLQRIEGRFDCDLGTVHHFAGGIYAKELHLPAGYEAIGHMHRYDHLSVLAKGVARVETDSESRAFEAPAVIHIPAGVYHRVTAIEDVTWLCVHRTDETDPERVDQVLIQKEG